MRPWLNTTDDPRLGWEDERMNFASMRPWLNTTDDRDHRFFFLWPSKCFNETVAQHHGRPRSFVIWKPSLNKASMRPWLNTTDDMSGMSTHWRPRTCFNETVAQHHGRRRVARFLDPRDIASMRPWLNTTDDPPPATL